MELFLNLGFRRSKTQSTRVAIALTQIRWRWTSNLHHLWL